MELLERYKEIYRNLPKGAKQRLLLLGHSHREIDYINNAEKYRNTSKVEHLILAMKQVTKDIAKDIQDKNNKIEKI